LGGPKSSEPRVLYFATESRLHRGPDGRIWSVNPNDWHENLSPWLRTFDRFVLIARVDEAPSSAGRPVEGPDVGVVAVEDYKGLRQLVSSFLRVRRTVLAACSDGSAYYGGRFPGVLAGVVLRGARRAGAPMLAHVVGDPRAVLGTGVAGRVGRLAARLAGLALRNQLQRVDAAIYVSKRQLQDLYPIRQGYPQLGRSDVALSPDSFAKEPRIYSPDKHQWRLAAVGSHDQMYKGHDLLISSLRELRAGGMEVTLDLVGSGKYHNLLRTLATEAGVAKHVRFHGHVASPQEVRRILDQADLFVMPSRTEGVPRALIEAMARGLPCLGSNVGGIPELLDSQFLFPSDDSHAMTDAIAKAVGGMHDWSQQSTRNIEFVHKMLEDASPEKLDNFLRVFTDSGFVLGGDRA
jgi:phosphatidylinositol alpha-1,6-mannosyltransferase